MYVCNQFYLTQCDKVLYCKFRVTKTDKVKESRCVSFRVSFVIYLQTVYSHVLQREVNLAHSVVM